MSLLAGLELRRPSDADTTAEANSLYFDECPYRPRQIIPIQGKY